MMRALSKTEGSLKWWFFACLLAIAVGVGFMGFNQWATTQDKYTAQANAETLAQDINSICKTEGKFLLNNRDVCNKGADVLENPTASIAGPKGEPGKDGLNGADSTVPGPAGKDGKDGVNGKDSTVPGPPGANGADGVDGTNGLNGADSTVPGPQGERGEQGEQGDTGPAPSSFTWTDSKNGSKYTCVPDPVGSTTYTCTEETPSP